MTEAATIAAQVSSAIAGPDGGVQRFVAVGGGADVRWLLPAKQSGLDTVLSSWTPYRLASRAGWLAVRAASRIHRLASLPGTAAVAACDASEARWAELGWRWGGQPVPVIYVGTPGPRRKAVVHLVERESGICRAVVKVALTNRAKEAILHEATTLKMLEAEGFEFAPRPLHVDIDREVATQTFVEGRPASRKLGPEHWRLLRSLLRRGVATSLRTHAQGWESQAAGLGLRDAMRAELDELRDDTPLPACWEHGDFTPWNIRRADDGRYFLLDWESAKSEGLPLMDAFHFRHMQDFLFGKNPRRHAIHLHDEATISGISTHTVSKLEAAYLIRSWIDCVRDGKVDRAAFVRQALQKSQRNAA